ncbi:MAG TPA: LppX_LprAFG lipoprotein [Jatrophihabitantaceae bacterium]
MRRTGLVALIGVVCALAAGCTTVTKGSATGPGQGGDGGTGAPTNGGGAGPVAPNVAGLAAQITHGSTKVKTAQGKLNVDAGPLTQASTFRQLMSAGQITTFEDQIDTTFQGNNTKIHVIYVDKTIYIDRGQNGKPWIVAKPDSSDEVAAQLAQTFPQSLAQSSIKYYAVMVEAAHDLKFVGTENIDGVPANHYHFIVDPKVLVQKLPPDQAQQMQNAVNAGVDSVPADEWVDAQGRPVRVTDEVTAQGQTAKIDLRLNHYDEPVSIKAPPADQVDQS